MPATLHIYPGKTLQETCEDLGILMKHDIMILKSLMKAEKNNPGKFTNKIKDVRECLSLNYSMFLSIETQLNCCQH
jgi:hypothetical protein